MKKTTWNKDRIALILLLTVIFIVAIASSIDSSEVDELCNTDNKIIKRIAGNWTCADDEVATTNETINNYTNNITNNISTINNYTTTINNQSLECTGGANEYIYNTTWTDGTQSIQCAADTDTDTWNTTAQIIAAINDYLVNLQTNITGVNNSLQTRVNTLNDTKLNTTDQRFNDTTTITTIANNLQTNITGLNTSIQSNLTNKAGLGSCPIGQLVNQTTASGVLCQTDSTGTGGGVNGTPINITGLTVTTLTTASCDVKAYTNGTTYCGTDASGSGNTTDYQISGHYYQHGVPVRDYNAWFCDFTSNYAVTACSPDYYGYVTGTGGISANAVNQLNTTYGIYSISKGTAAASGYRWTTNESAFILSADYAFSTVVNISLAIASNITRATMGFCDSTAINTACTDGVWFNVSANTTTIMVTGHNRNSTSQANTATNYNVTAGKYYIYSLKIINHTTTNFSVYDLVADTYVWSSLASGSIPNIAGRQTGSEVMIGTTTGSAAAIVAYIDYILTEKESNGRFK